MRMGTGHVMRCIALAQAWQDMGGEVALLSNDLPPALTMRVSAEGVRLMPLPARSDDVLETTRAAAAADWAVIDGYHFDQEFYMMFVYSVDCFVISMVILLQVMILLLPL